MSSTAKSAIEQYVDGDYESKHPDWHLADAPLKAADLGAGIEAMLADSPQKSWRIADIGAGAGGVLNQTIKRMQTLRPDADIHGCGIEISSQAVAMAKQQFPQLQMLQKLFEPSDGPFDAVMFVDVLEHVENPWELLRNARAASRYMLVRQPLLEGLSTFRHDNYRSQRETWGHIAFFSYRFFMDMAHACGWEPLKVDLQPPWELAGSAARAGIGRKLLMRTSPAIASYLLSGFYLNGVFRAR